MTESFERELAATMHEPSFADAMRRGVFAFDRYRVTMPHIPRAYSRTLLARTDEYELVSIHWAPGCVSAIHDHGASRCWVVLLEGTLEIDNFDRLDDGAEIARIHHASSATMRQGQLDHRLNWRELHRVRNTARASAYSLQLYAAPLTQYTIVNERTHACTRVASYDNASFQL